MPAKLTTEKFINKAIAKHGEKYNYSKVHYVNGETNVEIICPKHGPFWQTPHNHLRGKGCPVCGKSKPNTLKTFIEKARKVHGDKYDYSKVVFKRNKDKVEIICPIHGAFWQEANSHLQGHGCPMCKADMMKGQKHPERGLAIRKSFHKRLGVDNIMQDRSIVDKMEATKLANGTFHSSKCEDDLYSLLVNVFGEKDVIRQYKDENRYPFLADFYIPSRDMFIELNVNWTHGSRWYDPFKDMALIQKWLDKQNASYNSAIRTYTIRDVVKRNYAKLHGLNYIVFWDKTLADAKQWVQHGAPNGHDYLREYSWKESAK